MCPLRILGIILCVASCTYASSNGSAWNVTFDFELSFRRNDQWPLPNGTINDFILAMKALPSISSPFIPSDYVVNISVLWTTALVRIRRSSASLDSPSSFADPYDICFDLVTYLNQTRGAAVWDLYGITRAVVGFAPVDVPQWLRRRVIHSETMFTILGTIGALLAGIQGLYGAYYWHKTNKIYRKRATETEDET